MPEFYIKSCPKIFSRILGGHVPSPPPAPGSYAYEYDVWEIPEN